jgi:hypothetical protein
MRFSAPPDILMIVNAEIESRLQDARTEGIGRVRERNACGNCGESLGQWDWGTCPLCSAALERFRTIHVPNPNSVRREPRNEGPEEGAVPPNAGTARRQSAAAQVTLFGVEPVIKKGRRK